MISIVLTPGTGYKWTVLFSGKITNSVLAYVGRQGAGLEGLHEVTDLPEEFLRDPSCWLEAHKVEQFLEALNREFGVKLNDPNLMESIGHSCHELWAWGVLDSVLRMMPKAQDIYQQPHRFLSYFLSPDPTLNNVRREDEAISFEMPWSSEDFPLVSEYLRAALEALPSYLGKDRAVVRWRGPRVYIGWSEAQQSFFEEEEGEAHFKPELVKVMRASLEDAQRELEERKRELVLKDQEVQSYKAQMSSLLMQAGDGPEVIRHFSETWHIDERLDLLKSQVRRMDDYMVRAQQLVTLLIGQGRKDHQVAEAMKRMDWDYLRTTFPKLVADMVEGLQNLQNQIRDGSLPPDPDSAEKMDTRKPGKISQADQQLNL
ncbi:MAG: hypothetical protein H6624_20005 [Bdellovibrionaceae bacterium]|nr:hypothetical protein [Bdellovibrionales bacterium]MCB9086633.1 hypothetical protein [Pseudobdellovibrionaceae bacterium]MCB9086636.1 hypothetical protein [Pseudobdellovibrionaceae bacterium]